MEETEDSSQATTHIPYMAAPADAQRTTTSTAEQGGQLHGNAPAYKPYSIKHASINANGSVGPAGMVCTWPAYLSSHIK